MNPSSTTISSSSSVSTSDSNVTITESLSSLSLSSSPSSSLHSTSSSHSLSSSSSSSHSHKNYFRLPSDVKVHLIQDINLCQETVLKIYLGLQKQIFPAVLGFDVEWDDNDQVAMIQLAKENDCYLLHMSHMDSLPESLKILLEDSKVLKVGVGVVNDGKQIWQTYQIHTRGLLDLRPLAAAQKFQPLGLASLARDVCGGILLNKDPKIRCSQWGNLVLDDAQIEYAALDAWIGLHIFSTLNNTLDKNSTVSMEQLCNSHVDTRDTYAKVKNVNNTNKGKNAEVKDGGGHPVRKSLLYYDCQMMSPDGDILCKCDLKKISWYMDRGLGKIVNLTPLTIQLSFTPNGKGHSGDPFYMSAKKNQCVGCATTESLSKHSIIPHSYRCHLPAKYKSRTSHDIVLLCQKCHFVVSTTSHRVRVSVSYEFSHLLPPAPPKPVVSPELIKAQRAGAALTRTKQTIPPHRIEELTNELRTYFGKEEITEEDIQTAAKINVNAKYDNQEDEKIALILGDQGHDAIMNFVLKWRKNFLDTLQPKHMPDHWDVNHDFSA